LSRSIPALKPRHGGASAFSGQQRPILVVGSGVVCHLVDSFPLDSAYDRFEAADYGLNGTAWFLIASDSDGNLVFADSLYEKDLLPDEVAELVLAKRQSWGTPWAAYMDPSVWHRIGARNRWGAPAMWADEFADAGVPLLPGNNDPRAGYARLRTLMEPRPGAPVPQVASQAREEGGTTVVRGRPVLPAAC
jgi:hypothetical protein